VRSVNADDYLFAIAEIAAAFAGFSTLVVIVAQRLSGVRSEFGALALVNMLRLSLLVILFSLFPYLPNYSGASDLQAWRISSAFFALGWFVYLLGVFQVVSIRRALPVLSWVNKFNLFVAEPGATLALAAGAFGAWGSQTGLVYLSCLLVMLSAAGWLFLEQVVAIAREPAA
jgi:hypothetical protein